jgi:cytochrome P450
MGGMDTSATALGWDIAILCNYPEVQEKISAEIDGFIRLHERLPDFKDRESIPYCISVMKECMRFRPITPFGAAHTVQEDSKLQAIYDRCEHY